MNQPDPTLAADPGGDSSRPEIRGRAEGSLALLALLLGAALYLVGLDAIPVQCGNEAMYLYPPIPMLRTGDFLVPRYMHGAFLDKPPLTFWLIAASYRLLGVSVFAGRLPGVLAALATVGVVGLWVRRRAGVRAAILAAVCLTYSFKFAVFSRQFAADSFLTLAVTLAVIAIDTATRSEKVSDLRAGALAGAALALAFGFKGLIGVVLPVGAVAVGLLIDGTRPVRLRRRAPILLLVLFVAVLPWHWAMTQRFGMGFWRYFYWSNQFLRATTDVWTGHLRGPLFYLGVLAWGAFPWILFVPAALRRGRPSSTPLGWLLFGLLLLSAVVMKREVYVMPLFPAVAVLAGEWLAKATRPRPDLVRWGWVLTAAACIVAGVAWRRSGPFLLDLAGRPAYFGVGAGIAFLLASALAGSFTARGARVPLSAGLSCAVLFFSVLGVEARASRYDPMPDWGERVRRSCLEGCEAYRLGIKCSNVDYYAQREWVDLQEPRELLGRIPPQGGFLIARSHVERLLQRLGIQTELIEQRPWLEQNWVAAGFSGRAPEFVSLSLLRLSAPAVPPPAEPRPLVVSPSEKAGASPR